MKSRNNQVINIKIPKNLLIKLFLFLFITFIIYMEFIIIIGLALGYNLTDNLTIEPITLTILFIISLVNSWLITSLLIDTDKRIKELQKQINSR